MKWKKTIYIMKRRKWRLKVLRTTGHVVATWNIPFWKVTVKHWCFLKRCSNHYNITKRRTKKWDQNIQEYNKKEKEKQKKNKKNKTF